MSKREKKSRDYKPRKGSNAEFIAQHLHLPPPEIMRLAKQQKRSMTIAAIYTARSQLRKRATITRPDEVEVVPRRKNGTATSPEAQLRRLLLQLGSIAVQRLLAEYERDIERTYSQ